MDTSTQRTETCHIDLVSREANGTVQWFLEKVSDGVPKVPLVTANNTVQVYICGEEAFAAIADDLEAARHSIDIIAWGFDPAMELNRSGKTWPRGETYGELLERKAAEFSKTGGKVRLLVWHSVVMDNPLTRLVSDKAPNNMPGYDPQLAGLDKIRPPLPPGPPQAPLVAKGMNRDQYNAAWYRRVCEGRVAGLELRTRNPSTQQALGKHLPKPIRRGILETTVQAATSTDHQKMILIDYDHADGRYAIGYVMGLNSTTDYWDSAEHWLDDSRREVLDKGALTKEQQHEQDTLGQKAKHGYRTTKPLRDYACRLHGGALIGLNTNFCQAWDKVAPAKLAHPAGKPATLTQARQTPPPALKVFKRHHAQVQITRTYPDDKEQSIRAAYWQAVSWARNYIYIENQYFFYPEFAQQLSELRSTWCTWWRKCGSKPASQMPILHLIIVIPQAEKDSMVPRTYDTLRQLGHAENMAGQHAWVENLPDKKQYSHAAADAANPLTGVKEQSRKIDRVSREKLEKTLGLKVSVAMLRTGEYAAEEGWPPGGYREIYIHSKLMLLDDHFYTLGSANLNSRSMAVDSELNMSTNDHISATKLRKDIFTKLSGGKVTGGDGSREDIEKAFNKWETRMTDNQTAMDKKIFMRGFIVPYKDNRVSGLALE